MKRLLALVAAAALLAGCGGGVKQGEVVEHKHEAAYTWVMMQPQYMSRCSGNPPVCSTYIAYWLPIPVHEPERWKLRLKDCSSGECKFGWVNVDPATFDGAEDGSFFKAKP